MTCKPSKTLQVISSTRGWIHSLYPVYDAPIKGIRLHNNVMYMGKIIKAFYVFLLHNIYISNTKNDWITYWTSTPTYAIIWALSFKVTYLLKIYSPITMYFFGFLRQSSSQLLFLFIKTTVLSYCNIHYSLFFFFHCHFHYSTAERVLPLAKPS